MSDSKHIGEYHFVFVKVRATDGTEHIWRWSVGSKSAETRYIRNLRASGVNIIGHWTLTDGRRLNEHGERVP